MNKNTWKTCVEYLNYIKEFFKNYFRTLKLLHNTFLHPEMSGLPERNPVRLETLRKMHDEVSWHLFFPSLPN